MKQGDIWLLERPDHEARPALIITRDVAIPLLRHITVVPLTRTARNIPSEVRLGPADGIRVSSVASFDNVMTVLKPYLTLRLGSLGDERRHEMCSAMRAITDC